jgi:hypothetical protein
VRGGTAEGIGDGRRREGGSRGRLPYGPMASARLRKLAGPIALANEGGGFAGSPRNSESDLVTFV